VIALPVALCLPALVAWLWLERFCPRDGSAAGDRMLKLSLAGPFGVALGSLFYFVWSVIFTPSGRGMVAIESVLLGVVLAWMLIRRGATRAERPRPVHQVGSKRLWLAGRVSVVVTVCLGAVLLVANLVRYPHGHWDAWAIWNLRARFLFRAAEHWTDSFSSLLFWSSPDYPLCLPAFIAGAWKYMGYESVLAPMLVAAVFFAATLALLYSAVKGLSGRIPAAVVTVALAGTPLFVSHGASQYADVPLGFFFLATVVFMARHDYGAEHSGRWLILAGLAASLAAWTKNEGLLFLTAVFVSRMVVAVWSRGRARPVRDAARLLVGAFPVLVILAGFKLFLAPPSGFFAILNLDQVLEKLADPARYWTVLKAFFNQMSLFGNGTAPALLVAGVVVGFRRTAWRTSGLRSGLAVLALMLVGYFFVYVVTPQNLEWHLRTSIARLLLQLWPMTLFLFALCLGPSDESGRSGAGPWGEVISWPIISSQ